MWCRPAVAACQSCDVRGSFLNQRPLLVPAVTRVPSSGISPWVSWFCHPSSPKRLLVFKVARVLELLGRASFLICFFFL
ncbi:hypothetical protein Nepgr_002559 [Nepenthes gracilis]|uniref:Uncharacterized protein n=1 Tax=Nepenthes gracilis TaxID=150966 RepID=A0AAD3P3Z6_NEPGR|nr:hypothetical protein Nepgr_002559 [Nepenthes gracilis]